MRSTGDGRLGAGLLVFLVGMAVLGEARHRCHAADGPVRSAWGPLRSAAAGAAIRLGLSAALLRDGAIVATPGAPSRFRRWNDEPAPDGRGRARRDRPRPARLGFAVTEPGRAG